MFVYLGNNKNESVKLDLSNEGKRELYNDYRNKQLEIINHFARRSNYISNISHAKKLMPLIVEFIELASLLDLG